jgi:1,4-alpha-glucan branching enzyme
VHDTLGYLSIEPGDRGDHDHRVTSAVQYAHDERFVLPLGHDEVVLGKGSLLSKMGGDERQRFAALRMLFAWQWAFPGTPLVFMGSELAPWGEWTGQDAIPWHLLDQPEHRGVRDLVVRLNDVADSWPALWRRDLDPGGFQWLDADDIDHAMFGFARWDVDGVAAVVCLANVSDAARRGHRVGLPWAGRWDVVLDTDALAWNGSGVRRESVVIGTDDAWQGCSSSALLDIGPMSMVWLAAPSPG